MSERASIRWIRAALATAVALLLLVPSTLRAAGEPATAQQAPAQQDAAQQGPAPDAHPAAPAPAPPQARLEVTPKEPAAGKPVSLDASGSTGQIARWSWDLDGNGSFETHGGPRAMLANGLAAGRQRVAVRVASADGATSTAAATLDVKAPARPATPPAPKRSVVRAAAAGAVAISNFKFAPATITVHAGDTVTWTNNDSTPHTATGSAFNTGTLKKGQSGSHTFTSAGRFSYICAIHPFMKGTVVVDAAGGGGGSSSGSSSASATGSSRATAGAAPSAANAASGSSGTLPRTGVDLLALLLTGLVTTAVGAALRRAVGSAPRRSS